jgi:hypothetical protein
MAGDIQAMRDSAALGIKSLGLQQRSLNLNRNMAIANGIVGATQAAVNLAGAFDNYSKQKEIKMQTEGQEALRPILLKGVQTGDIRVEYDQEGNAVYSGLDDDTETGRAIQAWRARYSERISSEMGGMRWGNAGRAEKAFDQMLLESYYGALGDAVQKRYTDTNNLFLSNYQDQIQAAVRNGDTSVFETFMEESRGLMSPEIWEQRRSEGLKSIRLGQVKKEAVSTASQSGFAAAEAVVNQAIADGRIDESERDGILSAANNETSIAARATSDEIQRRIAQDRENSVSILNSRNGLMEWAAQQGDPQRRKQIEDAAASMQLGRLNEDFWDDMAGVYSLNRLYELRTKYQNKEPDYTGLNELHNSHLAEINSRIRGLEGASGGRSGSSQAADLEYANMTYSRYAAGDIDGIDAWSIIGGLDIGETNRLKYLTMMLDGQGVGEEGQRAFQALERYSAEQLLRLQRGDKDTPESLEFKARMAQIREHIGQRIFDTSGAERRNIEAYVNTMLDTERGGVLDRANMARNGDLMEAVRLSNSGALDYLQYVRRDQYANLHETNIGNSRERLNGFLTQSTQYVENMLSASAWVIAGGKGYFETRDTIQNGREYRDLTGQVHFDLVTGSGEKATVRIGNNGALEMRTESGSWVPFNARLPDGRLPLESARNQVFQRIERDQARQSGNGPLSGQTENR